jgi:histidyl-tRNA synthetase
MKEKKIIPPRVLKGFRDSLPAEELLRKNIQRKLEDTFERYSFVPIDTPVLEYTEILLGKGSGETDKQIYRFEDHGGRDVAMRFDLTVPFARYIAAHLQELKLPFRRYHIGKVFRGENTQRGRYREFIQCDFDIVGVDAVSADFEILQLVNNSFINIGVENIIIRLSHRGVFRSLLDRLGVMDRDVEILRTADRLEKAGAENVKKMLLDIVDPETADKILAFIQVKGTQEETLAVMEHFVGADDPSLLRLRELLSLIELSELAGRAVIDPSITRGLDYYTGMVFETFLKDNPGIGSVCSGGRYNDLASLYTKEKIPGVGGSIGLDRLLAALENTETAASAGYPGNILIFCMDETFLSFYHNLAEKFRKHGIAAEVFPEPKKIAAQFTYAERRGIPIGIICGEDEIKEGRINLKDLVTRESFPNLNETEALKTAAEILKRLGGNRIPEVH